MDKQSYLDAVQLNKVCDDFLVSYKIDIQQRDNIFDRINTALDYLQMVCCGESIDAFSAYVNDSLEKLCEAAKEADECDIRDIKILKSKITKSYDGKLICTSYETANKKRDEYLAKAANERRLAASFNTSIVKTLRDGTTVIEHINNPHEHLAITYQAMADGYQKEMDMWQNDMLEFDAIAEGTAGLFADGLAIRKEKFGVDVHQKFLDQLELNLKLLSGVGAASISIKEAISFLFKNIFKSGVTVTKPGWLIDNAGKYGLTEMEARYLEEYYPTLANSLYGLSKTDHQGCIDLTLKDMKSKLRDDYFYMMEGYGYSYEAISYLHENNPSLMAALDSHYGPVSIPDARMNIYTYLRDQGICVYDPVYDFGEYNVKSGTVITGNEVQFHTNCYSYAFGITRDPRTGELLPEGGLQPGYFSGLEDEYRREFMRIYSVDPENYDPENYHPENAEIKNDGTLFLKYIEADAEALGLSFERYEEGMTGGVRVALVIDPINDSATEIPDYHWYYYDEESGKWFNKQGPCPATDSYLGDVGDEYSPETGLTENQGVVFCRDGTYHVVDYGEPIGGGVDDYYKHATSCGPKNDKYDGYYQINVGEFYITRLDGGDFN